MLIAHFADSHLAAAGTLLDRDTGLNAALLDRARCLRFVFEDGVARGAQLFIGAGDLANSPRWTPTERRLAIWAMTPALEAGIPVLLELGNHEMTRNPEEKHALDTLRELPGLTIVDKPCLLNVYEGARPEGPVYEVHPARENDSPLPVLACQLACLPYPMRNLLLRDEDTRRLEPGALNLLVRERMMDLARGLAAQRVEGVPCLLVGHWSVDVAEAGKQNSLMMLGGEFTLNVHELQALGFDAVLLGHIHKPQQLLMEGASPVVYSGSPEACAFGEEGEEKRYCLWDVGATHATYQSIHTPYRRLVTLDLDASDKPAMIDESLRDCIVRVRIAAACASMVDVEQLRRDIEGYGAHEIRIEVQRAETTRRRETEIASASTLEQSLDAWLAQHPDYQAQRAELLGEAQRVEEQMGGVA